MTDHWLSIQYAHNGVMPATNQFPWPDYDIDPPDIPFPVYPPPPPPPPPPTPRPPTPSPPGYNPPGMGHWSSWKKGLTLTTIPARTNKYRVVSAGMSWNQSGIDEQWFAETYGDIDAYTANRWTSDKEALWLAVEIAALSGQTWANGGPILSMDYGIAIGSSASGEAIYNDDYPYSPGVGHELWLTCSYGLAVYDCAAQYNINMTVNDYEAAALSLAPPGVTWLEWKNTELEIVSSKLKLDCIEHDYDPPPMPTYYNVNGFTGPSYGGGGTRNLPYAGNYTTFVYGGTATSTFDPIDQTTTDLLGVVSDVGKQNITLWGGPPYRPGLGAMQIGDIYNVWHTWDLAIVPMLVLDQGQTGVHPGWPQYGSNLYQGWSARISNAITTTLTLRVQTPKYRYWIPA